MYVQVFRNMATIDVFVFFKFYYTAIISVMDYIVLNKEIGIIVHIFLE